MEQRSIKYPFQENHYLINKTGISYETTQKQTTFSDAINANMGRIAFALLEKITRFGLSADTIS